MKAYKELIGRILDKGQEREDRTGQGTLCIFGESIKMDLATGFPIVTLRKIDYKQAFGELTGFLRGYMHEAQFKSVGCNYWNGFGDDNGYLGPIYGCQWVNFNLVNQLETLISGLQHAPNSRRHILSTWNPNDIPEMCLPPCHIIAQFDVFNNKLSCIVYMRSVDVMLGLPYDIILYALLTRIIANQCRYDVGTLQFDMANTHIYLPHVMNAIRLEKLEPMKQASLALLNTTTVDNFEPNMAKVINYRSHPPMKFELFK